MGLRFLAVIPARGGSKGVPRKNIRALAGKPLLAWTIEAAVASGVIGRIAVSTEDEEIARVAAAYGAEVPLLRPAELASDDAPTLPVIRHMTEALEAAGDRFDAIITLQPTSPLRTAVHLREAVALFEAHPDADSLVSCLEVPHVFHPWSVMKIGPEGYAVPFGDVPLITRRQDKPHVIARNGAAIYITRRAALADFIFGGRLLPYLMPERDSIDIDTIDDWHAAEARIAGSAG